MKTNQPLKEIAAVFFKLGSIAFGGPAAHIAMMEEEIVTKRKWMSQDHFLDLMGATNLIPGPNSTEMTMHCGHERGGWLGLIVAGISFLFPAVVITAFFAWLYQKYGQLPNIQPFVYGIKPAVIAIIISAVYKLGKKALKNVELGILGTLTLAAALFGLSEIAALFACGFAGVLLYFIKKHKSMTAAFIPLITLQSIPAVNLKTMGIFGTFLKVGALLYGSGYVLFAYLDAELVKTGILSMEQIMDAVAVGQFTPGPVLSTATFIGWQLGGLPGALAATFGIFLPSFILVALLNPIIPRMRQSKAISTFLDAVNIGAVAVIIAVLIKMGWETLTDWRTIVIALVSIAITFKFKKINSALLVFGGSILGYILTIL
ncbi:MAG: chromate efflux transporter [Candidatus Marinimicrobia bacterium]|nr:chromate efflux transporter [Candidatus Neomarinimicrobiota bacterium]